MVAELLATPAVARREKRKARFKGARVWLESAAARTHTHMVVHTRFRSYTVTPVLINVHSFLPQPSDTWTVEIATQAELSTTGLATTQYICQQMFPPNAWQSKT